MRGAFNMTFRLSYLVLLCCAACGGGAATLGSGADPATGDGDAATTPIEGDGDADPPSEEPDEGTPTGLPCAVQRILEQYCQGCHGAVLSGGAPMRLVTLDDLRAPSVTMPGLPVYRAVAARVADPEKPMPPRPYEALSESDVQVLAAFAAAGAPTSGDTCEGGDAGPPDSAQPTFKCNGPGETGFDFLAHGPTANSKFPVSTGAESYHCFRFRAPWTSDGAQGVAFEPVVDDTRVLHHWLLYAEEEASGPDGTVVECDAAHPNATLLAGWAPGAQGLVMPSDVGLKLPTGPNAGLVLELHYNNLANHQGVTDASGVRVCTVDTPRKHTAGVHWLGTQGIVLGPGRGTVTGTCRPITQEPVHVIAQWPHMHTLGRHMKVELTRAAGGTELMHDAPFSFNNQVPDLRPFTIQPGDVIRTSCTYENDTGRLVTLGENTGDEMCFDFVTAYPIGGLVSALQLGVSQGMCIEPLF
jgi:hypothetical protein